MIAYYVNQGDCIGCIAYRHGHLPETIWNEAANSDLKNQRKDPNVLFPGDIVQIPEIQVKQAPCATEQRHRFKRKGIPIKLVIELRLQDRKLANEDYELGVGGKTIRRKTDGNGKLEASIHPDASDGWLRIRGRKIPFNLGTLDPVETTTGQQQRLNQVGHPCGPVDGIHGPLTSAGFLSFQKKHGLTENGQANRATLDKLKEDYGG
jgi:hypothetical protein